MGQYYMACIENDDCRKVFCPQNAVYMAKNGIKRDSDITEHLYNDDPNCWGRNFSGLKLMEHSWIENDFVNGVLESIWDKPSVVAWVGDCADEPFDFAGRYTKETYGLVWGKEKAPEMPFDEVPAIHRDGYIVNHDRNEYVDLARYIKVSGFTPKWDEGNVWAVHPLPILTAIGNGRGGGDYYGINMSMVGTWAMDKLSYTEDRPKLMEEVLIPFMEC